MASFCRSTAARGAARFAFRAHSAGGLGPRPSFVPRPPPLPSSGRSAARRLSRFAPALVSSESLMPLHNAIASSRLKSNISVNSRLWGWLTQGVRLQNQGFRHMTYALGHNTDDREVFKNHDDSKRVLCVGGPACILKPWFHT